MDFMAGMVEGVDTMQSVRTPDHVTVAPTAVLLISCVSLPSLSYLWPPYIFFTSFLKQFRLVIVSSKKENEKKKKPQQKGWGLAGVGMGEVCFDREFYNKDKSKRVILKKDLNFY